MKLIIDLDKLTAQNVSLIEPFLTKARLKVEGYEILEEDGHLTINNNDLDVATFLSFAPIAKGYEDYPIWIEIPSQYNDNDIPASFSFAFDDEGVRRKISDMTELRVGATNTIRYLQSITSKITRNDLQVIYDNPIATPMGLGELKTKLNDPNGEYYIDENLLI